MVDLSLPDYQMLIAQAGVNPDSEAARVASAAPEVVRGTGAALRSAGGEFDTSWQQSMGAQQALGSAFTNNGAEVLDRATHVANLPPEFRDAGTRLAGASQRLDAVADDLTSTKTQTATSVTGLHDELRTIRSNWAARVAAAGSLAGGLIPEAEIAGLIAERDRIAATMVTRVGEVGRRVVDRIRTYEGVLHSALTLLSDQGFVPVAERDTPAPPPPSVNPPGAADPTGFGTPLMAGYAADPVNTGLGNFVEVERDLPFEGLLTALSFSRTYNSRSDRSGPFGARWSSWASTRLVEQTWSLQFEGPDGQQVSFPRIGDRFGRAVGINALVERTATGLALAWFDGRRWEFDGAGRPERLWAGPGTDVRLVHDADGRLVELVHERGRRVLLSWAGERIVGVSGSDGRLVAYDYDEAGRLVTADGPAGARRYTHDDAGLVATVTDPDGVVELRNTYDEHGRVRTQLSPFGRLTTFDYRPDDVTVVADDAAGPTNTYRHDRAGRLLSATDGHGHSQERRYDRWGNPVEVVERNGAVTAQEFDDRARLTRRSLPSGAVLSAGYDDLDRVVTMTAAGTGAATAETRFRYEGGERIPSEIIDPEGGRTVLAVAGGLVHAITDPDGVVARFRYDADGNLVEARDAGGGVTLIERDRAGRAVVSVTPAGRRTELSYDSRGLLVQRRDPAGGVWRHEYSPAGRRTAVVDPTGARTEVHYGEHGRPIELVDALGAVRSRGYDVFGNVVGETEADGSKWTYVYDALSRLTAWTDPAGGSWLREHDVQGHRVAEIDPTGVRTSAVVDASGRVVTSDDGLVTQEFGYDEFGRTVSQLRPDGAVLGATYDRCGRVLTRTAADGGITRHTYSAAGRLLSVVSPAGRREEYRYDGCGRLCTVVDGNGQCWEQRHDADGLLIERVSPAGLVETIERDAAGRVLRHRAPGRGHLSLSYDPAGRVVAVADRNGLRRFTHDAAGRITAATDALGNTVHYGYDDRGRLISTTDPTGGRTLRGHDELGRLVSLTDALGRTTHRAYDAAGRPIAVTDPTGARRRRTYDRSGRLATLTTDGGTVITIERDRLARPVRITESGRAGSGSGRASVGEIELRWNPAGHLLHRRAGGRQLGWSYDADGLRTALTYPDGTRTGYQRDGAGRVTALEHPVLGRIRVDRDPDGRLLAMVADVGSSRWHYAAGWLAGHDRAGDGSTSRTTVTRDEQGRVVAADTDGRTSLFGYDPAGQLTEVNSARGAWSLGYDAVGRLTSESGPDGVRSLDYDAAGQLAQASGPDGRCRYGYDGAGRRVSEDGARGQRRFDWDELGRLTAISTATDGGTCTTSVRVDPLGELAQVDDTALSWDSADPLLPLAAVGDQAVIGLGQPWALAGPDGPEPLLPSWQHDIGHAERDPWGAPAAGTGLGFRGEFAVEGLVWLRNRAYDPDTRAFLQPDPLPPVSGTAYAANAYHYAGNDPVNAVDPLGLRPVTDADLAAQRDEDGGSWLSDLGHGALDVVGLVPGVGEVADLANAAWYTAEGNYGMAALSAAAAIPFAGWAATGAKGVIYGTRAAKALEGATTAGELAAKPTAVIGRLEDTAVARNWPGHEVLNVPDWSIAKNDAWVQSVVDRGLPVYVGSPTTSANLWDDVAGRQTVFARELDQFKQAGYTQNGYDLLPPGG